MPDVAWQKSSFSSGDVNQNCLEVATTRGDAGLNIRESDTPTVVLTGTRESLRALLTHLKAGQLGH